MWVDKIFVVLPLALQNCKCNKRLRESHLENNFDDADTEKEEKGKRGASQKKESVCEYLKAALSIQE